MAAQDRDPYAQGLALSARNRHAEAIERFEEALRHDPHDIRVLFALGNTARMLGMAKPAEAFFRRVLSLEPQRVEALVNLANLLRAEGNFGAAEVLLAPALTRDPQAPELWLTLGSVYREKGDGEGAARLYREALALRPNYPPALGNLADLLADDGKADEAFALYDRLLKQDPKNHQARLNRAILHFLRGDLKEGWRDYAARLNLTEKVPLADHGLAKWSGQTLRRCRLLVTAEQGIGDQLMFASVYPELCVRAEQEGASVILECEKRLVPLFARSFPQARVAAAHIESRGGVVHARYDWLKASGGANTFVEMGSVPKILRPDLAQFPLPHCYLVADKDEVGRWRGSFGKIGPQPHVGICWRSGKTGGARASQYAPLAAWAEFLRDLPGTLVVAQYDASADEVAALQYASGRQLLLPPSLDQKNELDRTCAMLSALDAVISAPTAVSWLAAGSGVPTFKILYDTSWTAFGQTFEPFAPACKLVMPQTRGDWADAFAKAKQEVSALSAAA